jgi:hypothetical protein
LRVEQFFQEEERMTFSFASGRILVLFFLLFCRCFRWWGTVVVAAEDDDDGADDASGNNRGLVDLVELVPFTVQIAVADENKGIQFFEVSTIVTDWMNQSFSQQLEQFGYTVENEYATLDSVVLFNREERLLFYRGGGGRRSKKRKLQQQPDAVVAAVYMAEFRGGAVFTRQDPDFKSVPVDDVLLMQQNTLFDDTTALLLMLQDSSATGLGSAVVEAKSFLDYIDDNNTGTAAVDNNCNEFSTCIDCIDQGCSWAGTGECLESCDIIADAPCYSTEYYFDNMTAEEICNIEEDRIEDFEACSALSNCTDCVSTLLPSDENRTCMWFAEFGYCDSACGMNGCGVYECPSDDNPFDDEPEVCVDWEENQREFEEGTQNWTNPACYEYEIQYVGFFPPDSPYLDPIFVKVVDDTVVESSLEGSPLIQSMNGLMDQFAQQCFKNCPDQGAYRCSAEYDAKAGYILSAFIDEDARIADEELSYQVLSFAETECELEPSRCIDWEENGQAFEEAMELYTNPECYEFTIQYFGEFPPDAVYAQPTLVQVRNETVIQPVDADGFQFRTMNGLLEEFAQQCFENCPEEGAYRCQGEFNETEGYILSAFIDFEEYLADEETIYRITEWRTLDCQSFGSKATTEPSTDAPATAVPSVSPAPPTSSSPASRAPVTDSPSTAEPSAAQATTTPPPSPPSATELPAVELTTLAPSSSTSTTSGSSELFICWWAVLLLPTIVF